MKKILYILTVLIVSSTNMFASAQSAAIPELYPALSQKLYNYGGLRAYGFMYQPGVKLIHEVVGFYDIPQMGKVMKLVITASRPNKDHECHACAPKISFFVFEKKDGKWYLRKSYLNIHKMGQWGHAPNYDAYQVIKLSDDKFGLFLKGGVVLGRGGM